MDNLTSSFSVCVTLNAFCSLNILAKTYCPIMSRYEGFFVYIPNFSGNALRNITAAEHP